MVITWRRSGAGVIGIYKFFPFRRGEGQSEATKLVWVLMS